MRFVILLLFIISSGAFASDQKKLTVVYTSSLSGYLDYCTCESSPKGGLVKRGSVIAQLRSKNPNLLLVDTGDILPTYIDDNLPPYLFKAYKYLSYDAITFGDQDLDFGITQFVTLTKSLPLVSGNILFINQPQPFPLYRIIRKGNLSVALIAGQDPTSFRYALSTTRQNIIISDPIEHLRKIIELKSVKAADAVIILAHGGRNATTAIDEAIDGAAVIIGGHDQTVTENPVQGKHSIIVHAGGYGARIGVLDITLSDKKAALISHRFIQPDASQPVDDPYIRSLINAYQDEKGI